VNTALEAVGREITACTRCPRLVAWRTEVAAAPPARFAGQEYWARPVPGFGDPGARIHVLGLATAAHGGNRTGRAFTGNPTADWVVHALHRAGLANQPTSEHAGDGLRLRGVWLGSAVRCAPPGNRPTPAERDACLPFLSAEVAALPELRALVCLGAFAWQAALHWAGVRPKPRFAHGAEHRLDADHRLSTGHRLGTGYQPSSDHGTGTDHRPGGNHRPGAERGKDTGHRCGGDRRVGSDHDNGTGTDRGGGSDRDSGRGHQPGVEHGTGAEHGARHGTGTGYGGGLVLLGSYHPSRQNTNTGVLTEVMLDAVFARARDCAGL
jgi:uracil-DNA glycosylase family 4